MPFALCDPYGKKYSVNNQLQIGSDPSCQIVLIDPQITPFHATFSEQQNRVFLQDNTGGSATQINGSPVLGVTEVKAGDRISFANTIFILEDLNAPPPAAPANVPFYAPPPPSTVTPPTEGKKRPGCGRWVLIALIAFLSECVLIALAVFIFSRTDVEIRGGLQDLKSYLASDSPLTQTAPSDKNLPGPDVIKLDEQWLTSAYSHTFTQSMESIATGVSPENVAASLDQIYEKKEQDIPIWVSYESVKYFLNDELTLDMETSIIEGIRYTGYETCVTEPVEDAASFSLDDIPYRLLSQTLTGHAKLVEEGVNINGILTDRYQIRKENFVESDTIIELVDGSFYRAREGGYLVQLDYTIRVEPQSWPITIGQEFSDTEPAQISFHFERTYLPDEPLSPQMPVLCQ